MRIVAIIQARMGSTRLPCKVMIMLNERTVLEHVINRVRACSMVDEVVIATTTNSQDDIIIKEADQCGVKWYRGSEEDVLARYYESAREFEAEIIVRVTSDCPLFDPELLCAMLERFLDITKSGIDVEYLSNTITRTYPRGLDAEIFTFAALEKAFNEAKQGSDREHVTSFIWKNPNHFILSEFTGDSDLSHHRWTLDTPEDLELIKRIYDVLFLNGEIFTTGDVLAYLKENPGASDINARSRQKELKEQH